MGIEWNLVILFGRRWLQFLLIAQVMILNRVENFGKVVEGKEQGGPGSGLVGILYIFILVLAHTLTSCEPVGLPLDPWDPECLPLDTVGPWIGIKDQLADLSRPICPCCICLLLQFFNSYRHRLSEYVFYAGLWSLWAVLLIIFEVMTERHSQLLEFHFWTRLIR